MSACSAHAAIETVMAKKILQSMGMTCESNLQIGVSNVRIVAETPSIPELRYSTLCTSGSQDASTEGESFGLKAAFRSGSEPGV